MNTPIRISSDTIVRTLLIGFAAYALFVLRDIILMILVAIVIASFVESGVRAFARIKVSRLLAVPIIYAIVTAIIFAVFYAFVPIIFKELSGVLSLISKYIPSSSLDTNSIQDASQIVTNISKNSSIADLLSNVKNVASSVSAGATSIIGNTFGGLVNTILVLVMSFYLSIQERGIQTFLRIITPAKHEKYVIDLWVRTQRKIGLWFQGQLLLGLVMAAVTFVGLSLLGVQYALLIAIITGIAELIPFGVVFAAIPAVLFALIDGGVLLGFKTLIFYIVVQQIENYVLSPVIVKRVVGIPPLIVLVAFLIGITLAGFFGAILAIPVAVFVLEYMGDVEKNKYVTVIEN
ncbi:MAG TPA: AI-2E family transporter [Candidatus Paceibacterota bacterium]|jgi:predicted PurR-regulated permease PerM|nr:AI-2E family transporter [Candidatus Paceibacterota bacterium]